MREKDAADWSESEISMVGSLAPESVLSDMRLVSKEDTSSPIDPSSVWYSVTVTKSSSHYCAYHAPSMWPWIHATTYTRSGDLAAIDLASSTMSGVFRFQSHSRLYRLEVSGNIVAV